ncbi:GNAT family N-acetyltransferase [Actinoplanes utahensis]|uniref:GCN5 family acetyltransferase n=1 Tax=Actinoplanes utahensis TaxID=1869 RepID=A0A0A6UKK8_ACTUT|nr:GNAT family N-acetyltransferase [Actinoplanes utahensis]KHD75618.1 GCN5 family acetyltransferase [Actinoplanes utahensis]GIF27143.1 hypothetical protein Aut01nite_01290 [Actinoplanes utahensis]
MSDDGRYTIRSGRASDIVEVARLQASVQLQPATGGSPHPGIAAWVEDLMDGHPSVTPGDFLVAEDAATGRVVAGLAGLRQDWSLAGLRLPVAQVELVGTAPPHRGNRLTERLFAALHQRYAADGVPVQMIEGIPYFYRRLGYEYALAGDGAATVTAVAPEVAATVPATAPEVAAVAHDQPGGWTARPATVADTDALAAIDGRLTGGDAWSCPRDAAVWRYEIGGRRDADIARRTVAVVVRDGRVGGYLVHGARLSAAGELIVVAAACREPADWVRAAPVMYAHLGHVGRQHAAPPERPFTAVRPLLDPRHPLVRLGPPGTPRRPRGWYLRTGDPAGLLARLRPLLRDRWDAAGLRWPEPVMTIDMYGRAARLEFRGGRLTSVTAVPGAVSPSTDPRTHAAIPPGALLQLAFGHRSLPEALETWPDLLPRDHLTGHFLTAAFPRVPVALWPRT